MNRFIMLAVAIALSPVAGAQLYKYVDKDGKTVYTDQPPANAESKALRAPAPAPAPAPPPAAPAEKPKAPPKAAQAARDSAPPKAEPPALTEAQKEERCQAARANYVIFLDGPVTMRDNKTGERFQLDEKQTEAERAKAKAAMDEVCKKP